jgi:hypothetical protein
MSLISPKNIRLILLFFLVVLIACSPIWGVGYFINQDGSPHLYNAYLMGELLNGNPHFLPFFEFNSISVPNSSGHWLLVAMLQFFSPFVVTKLIVTFTYAAFVATIVWLRFKTAGHDCLKTSLLIGAALGFNWMWFLGFYNFSIGVITFVFTVALFFGWRGRMNVGKAAVLSLLLLIGYLSHLVSFGILSGSIAMMILFSERKDLPRTIIFSATAFIPVIPLAILFKALSASGEGFFPVWRSLGDYWSVFGIFNQLRTFDPFIIISRRSFPFSEASTPLFAVFTPILWIGAAYILLGISTIREKRGAYFRRKEMIPFVVLFVGSMVVAVLGPDDFGLTNGGILRERILLCGLCFYVPLFRANANRISKRAVQFCLAFVIIFQTTALWEYSLRSDAMARELFSAGAAIEEGDAVASVVIIDNATRFHAIPEPQLNTLNGLGRNILIWDNYEMGHYLFPLVAKSAEDRQFILAYSASYAYAADNPRDNLDEKILKYEKCLEENHERIRTMMLWGRNERYEQLLRRWFGPEPYFTNGRIRLFRHKETVISN